MYATETSCQCARPSARLSLTRQRVPATCQIAPYLDPPTGQTTRTAHHISTQTPVVPPFARARARSEDGHTASAAAVHPHAHTHARTHARSGKRSATGAVSVCARHPEAASPGAGRGEARALARRLGHSGDERRSGIADARGGAARCGFPAWARGHLARRA
ncbi:hypothetical protein HETIRDRAFT_145992 [Heterobasidion irregulare TC 32-1]|uniref:Uncharacterized protein n=1 Tax=Heterobasidion irregulare (strain TC 32-1) TaxID=747525 RepID=W4KIF5_HETIT|nr:uncharacterized protein HETIRDRAFT_145992 [Heterobasidion irregulare TC 32-1]ETW85489.1 hypothetical protein HETIRDRAFT_145992 [Heterobasidion irregulare TC 32-1]